MTENTQEETPSCVSIEDFAKLDIRIATIIDATPHPNADKLICLKVQVGNREKQIVAGIKAFYVPEALKGKQIAIIDNLKPVTLRGEMSEGMLLAAKDDHVLRLLSPDAPMASGAKVS